MTKVSKEEMGGLVQSGIVALKGHSGQPTTVEMAAQAPGLCQAHGYSGNVYDLEFDGRDFTLIPVKIVYTVS